MPSLLDPRPGSEMSLSISNAKVALWDAIGLRQAKMSAKVPRLPSLCLPIPDTLHTRHSILDVAPGGPRNPCCVLARVPFVSRRNDGLPREGGGELEGDPDNHLASLSSSSAFLHLQLLERKIQTIHRGRGLSEVVIKPSLVISKELSKEGCKEEDRGLIIWDARWRGFIVAPW